ncbi:hypothetical protein ABIA35_001315 [Catenulispora sp. MAP12-49]|jgi:hypothetical protein
MSTSILSEYGNADRRERARDLGTLAESDGIFSVTGACSELVSIAD